MKALTLILLAACSEPAVVVGRLEEMASLKAIPDRDLDILFVVDNSPSMLDNQVALAASFPKMMDVLAELDGGLPNLHIGIVTSDMGTKGSQVDAPGPALGVVGEGGCSGVGDNGALQHAGLDAAYIEDLANDDGTRQRNYTGALRDVFTTAAMVGDGGCGFEQHLAAMRAGLTNPANAGFLRPSANLAVVILADEDDCSMLDPVMLSSDPVFGALASFRCFQFGVRCSPDVPDDPGAKTGCVPRDSSPYIEDVVPFAQFLRDTKGDERKVMVAGVVGDPSAVNVELGSLGGGPPAPQLAKACSYGDNETADPAVRISAFLDQFPQRSQLASICSGDLSVSLHDIGQSAKRLVGDPCLDTTLLADSSPDPGVQPACEVSDVRDAAPDAPTALAHCSTGAADCYDLVEDSTACPATSDHLRVRITRHHAPTDDTWTHVRCQLAP